MLPQVMGNNERAVTLGLRDGFYHFTIHPDCVTYLGFRYGGAWYVWRRLPFGWSGSPYFFHKCIRALIQNLRSVHQLSFMAYVDDFLLASSPSCISAALQVVSIQCRL